MPRLAIEIGLGHPQPLGRQLVITGSCSLKMRKEPQSGIEFDQKPVARKLVN
jgi:hypothetical protein